VSGLTPYPLSAWSDAQLEALWRYVHAADRDPDELRAEVIAELQRRGRWSAS
jgi:hypothetical protein